MEKTEEIVKKDLKKPKTWANILSSLIGLIILYVTKNITDLDIVPILVLSGLIIVVMIIMQKKINNKYAKSVIEEHWKTSLKGS